ncbi:MAG: hypothetical protein QNJ97_17910 [Myxococcota bacterium]|nr:hypothetical protein [Myxococcota bacterium]
MTTMHPRFAKRIADRINTVIYQHGRPAGALWLTTRFPRMTIADRLLVSKFLHIEEGPDVG